MGLSANDAAIVMCVIIVVPVALAIIGGFLNWLFFTKWGWTKEDKK